MIFFLSFIIVHSSNMFTIYFQLTLLINYFFLLIYSKGCPVLVAPPLLDIQPAYCPSPGNHPVSSVPLQAALPFWHPSPPGLKAAELGGKGKPLQNLQWNRTRSESEGVPPWTTGTTGRPGTATWPCWRRPHGRSWTRRTRMGWHRPCGPPTTATWRHSGSS